MSPRVFGKQKTVLELGYCNGFSSFVSAPACPLHGCQSNKVHWTRTTCLWALCFGTGSVYSVLVQSQQVSLSGPSGSLPRGLTQHFLFLPYSLYMTPTIPVKFVVKRISNTDAWLSWMSKCYLPRVKCVELQQGSC